MHDVAGPSRKFSHQVELAQIEFVPRNARIILQRRFDFFPGRIHGEVDLLQRAVRGIFDESRPCVIGLSKRYSVDMPRSTIASERFIGNFSDVGPAHNHKCAGRSRGVGHLVCARGHPRHRADPNQSDLVPGDEVPQVRFAQRLRVTNNKVDFVLRRR